MKPSKRNDWHPSLIALTSQVSVWSKYASALKEKSQNSFVHLPEKSMIHETFAVYDSKAGAFLPPFILPRVEMAQRVFSDCVNSEDHQFALHPDDYTLFQLGSFDDESGKFMPRQNGKLSLGNGIEYMDFKHQAAPPEGKANGQKVSDDPPILPGTESGDSAE